MKKQKSILFIFMLAIVTALTGCGKELKLVVGSWNDHVFENTWLNMKFTAPDNWTIASDKELSEILNVSVDKMKEIQGTSKKAMKAASKMKSIYGFLTYAPEGTMRVQLIYENLDLSNKDKGTKINVKEYQDSIKDQLANVGYTYKENSTEKIAGKSFERIKFTDSNNKIYQEYYSCKLDGYMVTLMFIYSTDQQSVKDDYVKNIQVLDKK